MNERVEKQRDNETGTFIHLYIHLYCACLLINKQKVLTFFNATAEVKYIFLLCLKIMMSADRLNIITVHLTLTVLIYLALLNAIANLDTPEMEWIVPVGFLNLS